MTWNSVNYSQPDMLSMQRDAMNRVQDMQKRAQQHISQGPSPQQEGFHQPSPPPRESTPRNQAQDRSPPTQNQTNQGRQPRPMERPNINNPGNNDQGLNLPFLPFNFLEKFNLDSDRLILIGLALVLLNEGGDRTLLLALIYIFLN